MATFRILSFDGGGIRGLIELYLLKRLQSFCPSILERVDLLAGTSTGGFIALGLAQGDKVDDLISLYENEGAEIFQKSLLGVGGLMHCRYNNDGYRKLLVKHFGDRKLGGLQKRVLVSSFNINASAKLRSWRPKLFVNFPDTESDCDLFCVDVALYTGAAPTYFPIVDYHIDGGVCANNPSMCALACALATGTDQNSVRLLSMGTGLHPEHIDSKDGAWGLVQWAPKLVDLMISGDELITDYQCRHILRSGYLRVNPIIKEDIALDDWRACDKLKAIAIGYDLSPVVQWLKREWSCV